MAVPAQIPLTTKTPGTYTTVTLGTRGVAGQAVPKVLMLGMRVGGTATDNTITQVENGTHADTLFGAGSSLARMCRCAIEEARGTQVYGGVIATIAGTAAVARVTFAAGPAGADCSYEITINGWTVTTAIPATTTAAAAAGLVVAAIQGHDNYSQMPILATDGGGGLVNLTAKETNVESTWAVTNIWQDATALVTLTATLNTGAVAGAGAIDISNVLAAAITERYNYIVCRTSDATNGGRLEAHLDTYASAINAKNGQGIIGSMDTPANQITMAQSVNAHRVQVIGCELFQTVHYENIARWVAHRQYEEASEPGTAYKYYPLQRVMPPHLTTSYMSATEIEAALNGGVTPLVVENGEVQVPRSITSRSQTAAGAPDYTVLDTSNVTVPDWCAFDIKGDFAVRYTRKTGVAFKVMDDPADGNIPQYTATPSIVEDDLEGKMWSWYELGLIVHPKSPTDYIAQIAASYAAYRINAQVPVPVAPGLMITDINLIQETG